MLQVGGDLDLDQEALGTDRGCQVGLQDLESDASLVLQVLRQVDRAIAPSPSSRSMPYRSCRATEESREGVAHRLRSRTSERAESGSYMAGRSAAAVDERENRARPSSPRSEWIVSRARRG